MVPFACYVDADSRRETLTGCNRCMRPGVVGGRLDVMPATVAKFRTNGDPETADLLEHIIYKARLAATLGLCPLCHLRALRALLMKTPKKSPDQACVHIKTLSARVEISHWAWGPHRRRSRTAERVCGGCHTCTRQRTTETLAATRPPGWLRHARFRQWSRGSTTWFAPTSRARSRCAHSSAGHPVASVSLLSAIWNASGVQL